MQWLVLQLADSAFPTGGFAHSGGLEAAVQLGEVEHDDDLRRFLDGALWQAACGALPLVRAGHAAEDLAALVAVDARCQAFVTGHVANRASRTQGRAFAATCARSFVDDAALGRLDAAVRAGTLHGHLAPVFGAALRVLGIGVDEALAVYLHLALRGVVSAAVRLGRIGPHEAQRLQFACAGVCDAALAVGATLPLADIGQTAPLQELMGTAQDRLYSRLFQS